MQQVLERIGVLQEGRGGDRSTMARVASMAPALALLTLAVVGFAASSRFLTAGNIKAILVASSILMILAVGQTFVISTGGIDLSIAAATQLSMVTLGAVFASGAGISMALLSALAVGTAAGLFNGWIVAKGKVGDFIVTLGTFSAFTGLTLLVSDAKPQVVTSPFLIKLGSGSIGPIPVIVLVALVTAVVAWVTLFRAPFGTHVLAVGGNKAAAAALGLRFDRVKMAVYTISGLCAGIASILLVARLGAAEPTAGSQYQLTSIAAAVLGGVSLFGGKSSIVGPILGAIILTGILNLLNVVGVDVYYQPIAVGAVVVLSAVLRRFEES